MKILLSKYFQRTFGYFSPKFIFRIKTNESTVSLKNLRSDSDTGPAEHCAGGSILISWYSWKSKNCTVNPLINKWGKVFKNGPSKIFKRLSSTNFTWFIIEYFVLNMKLILYHGNIWKHLKTFEFSQNIEMYII